MLELIHLEINNGKTADEKLAIHVIGIKATDTYSLTVYHETNGDGNSWHEEGPSSDAPIHSGEFWHDLTEGAIYGIVSNWTRDTDRTPDDFLNDPKNAWMNRFEPADFTPENWIDATQL